MRVFGKKTQEKAIFVVQVKEDGSIVLPKEAMELFSIMPGDKVALLGEKSKGLVIMKNDIMVKMIMKGQVN